MRSSSDAAGRRPFLHDALTLIGNRFMVMGVGVLSGVILARCLGAEGRGLLTAILVYPSIFLSLTEMGVRQSSTYYLGKQLFTDRQVVGSVSALMLLTASIGVVLVSGLMLSTGNTAFTPVLIALAVASVPLTIARDYCTGVLLGKRQVGQFARIQLWAEVQRLLLIVLSVWWLVMGVAGALGATLLAGLLVTGLALRRVTAIAPPVPRFEWPVLRALVSKGAIYSLALFVLTLNYKIDIALMERLTTVSEIGIYTIAVGVAQLTWALPSAITTALFSHSATARDGDAFSRKVVRLFRVNALISLLLVLFLALAAPILIPAIYGSHFQASVRPLHLLLPGVFCLVALKILAIDLAGRGRPNLSLWISIPALFINVTLNLWLLPRYGAIGAAIASSVSYAFAGIGLMLLYCRVVEVPLSELWRYKTSDFEFLKRLDPSRTAGRKHYP